MWGIKILPHSYASVEDWKVSGSSVLIALPLEATAPLGNFSITGSSHPCQLQLSGLNEIVSMDPSLFKHVTKIKMGLGVMFHTWVLVFKDTQLFFYLHSTWVFLVKVPHKITWTSWNVFQNLAKGEKKGTLLYTHFTCMKIKACWYKWNSKPNYIYYL